MDKRRWPEFLRLNPPKMQKHLLAVARFLERIKEENLRLTYGKIVGGLKKNDYSGKIKINGQTYIHFRVWHSSVHYKNTILSSGKPSINKWYFPTFYAVGTNSEVAEKLIKENGYAMKCAIIEAIENLREKGSS
ncbi:hypothetical protein ACFL11_01620 [Patescibacteria group bacterium]